MSIVHRWVWPGRMKILNFLLVTSLSISTGHIFHAIEVKISTHIPGDGEPPKIWVGAKFHFLVKRENRF